MEIRMLEYLVLTILVYRTATAQVANDLDLGKRQNVINRRCYECHETDAPFKCLTLAKCGNGEICFTREFTDHNGRKGYHLGCEDKNRCNLFKNAGLLGKRGTMDDVDDSSGCFDCCDADDCNNHLCVGSLAVNSTFVGSGTCPPTFVTGPRSCFYIANWAREWEEARTDCKRMGADLASIDDQSEDFFLVGFFNSLTAASNPTGYWLGGYYITALKEWAWLDMTKVDTYSRWGPGEPDDNTYNYRIAMRNPTSSSTYTDWSWSTESYGTDHGFICERPFL